MNESEFRSFLGNERERFVNYVRSLVREMAELDAEDERLIDVLKDLRANPLEELQTQQSREALFAALDRLNETERAVVIAHEFEGVPFRQLSEDWQMPINTLLSHKSRAIRKLRGFLTEFKGA